MVIDKIFVPVRQLFAPRVRGFGDFMEPAHRLFGRTVERAEIIVEERIDIGLHIPHQLVHNVLPAGVDDRRPGEIFLPERLHPEFAVQRAEIGGDVVRIVPGGHPVRVAGVEIFIHAEILHADILPAAQRAVHVRDHPGHFDEDVRLHPDAARHILAARRIRDESEIFPRMRFGEPLRRHVVECGVLVAVPAPQRLATVALAVAAAVVDAHRQPQFVGLRLEKPFGVRVDEFRQIGIGHARVPRLPRNARLAALAADEGKIFRMLLPHLLRHEAVERMRRAARQAAVAAERSHAAVSRDIDGRHIGLFAHAQRLGNFQIVGLRSDQTEFRAEVPVARIPFEKIGQRIPIAFARTPGDHDIAPFAREIIAAGMERIEIKAERIGERVARQVENVIRRTRQRLQGFGEIRRGERLKRQYGDTGKKSFFHDDSFL